MGAITSAIVAASLAAGKAAAAGATALGASAGVASGISAATSITASLGAYGAIGYGASEALGAAKDMLSGPDIPEAPPPTEFGSEGVRKNADKNLARSKKTRAMAVKQGARASDMTLGGGRQTLA